jgi:hypothetical protein
VSLLTSLSISNAAPVSFHKLATPLFNNHTTTRLNAMYQLLTASLNNHPYASKGLMIARLSLS